MTNKKKKTDAIIELLHSDMIFGSNWHQETSYPWKFVNHGIIKPLDPLFTGGEFESNKTQRWLQIQLNFQRKDPNSINVRE